MQSLGSASLVCPYPSSVSKAALPMRCEASAEFAYVVHASWCKPHYRELHHARHIWIKSSLVREYVRHEIRLVPRHRRSIGRVGSDCERIWREIPWRPPQPNIFIGV